MADPAEDTHVDAHELPTVAAKANVERVTTVTPDLALHAEGRDAGVRGQLGLLQRELPPSVWSAEGIGGRLRQRPRVASSDSGVGTRRWLKRIPPLFAYALLILSLTKDHRMWGFRHFALSRDTAT